MQTVPRDGQSREGSSLVYARRECAVRHGRLAAGRLDAGSIARVVKRAAAAAGLDPALYAGHSLRAGFATQAFLNGVTEVPIMRQTRHKSLNTLRKYIRDRLLFRDNPAAKLGL